MNKEGKLKESLRTKKDQSYSDSFVEVSTNTVLVVSNVNRMLTHRQLAAGNASNVTNYTV